jgi:3-hydroxyacyl-CoA dehydrogenase
MSLRIINSILNGFFLSIFDLISKSRDKMKHQLNIKTIGVIGGGTMGVGIIYTLSKSGFPVVFKELNESLVKKCLEQVTQIYSTHLKKGKITEKEMKKCLNLINGRMDYQGCEEVDLIIEAIPEEIEIKKSLFHDLDRICKPETIFASNTSAIPISELASFTQRRSKFIGMHWFNPAHVMRLIEVVPGLDTSEETIETMMMFCEKIGKIPIRVKECPGFLVARILGMYINEAFWMAEEGYSPVEIDQAGLEMGMPMGPFTLGDMAGWDVVYHANLTLYEAYGSRFNIPPSFHKLVASKKFGVKSGQGIYSYKMAESGLPQRIDITPPSLEKKERKLLSNRLFCVMVNEGIRCLDEGIGSREDIDKAMQLGAGMPKGPLEWADEVGLDWIFKELDDRKEAFGDRYWPSPLLRRKVKAGHLGRKAGKGFFDYRT